MEGTRGGEGGGAGKGWRGPGEERREELVWGRGGEEGGAGRGGGDQGRRGGRSW